MLYRAAALLNTPLTPDGIKYEYNINIEQYRGLCAILVLLNHATAHEDMLLNNFKWPTFVSYINSGYLSVLVFFCISGYAIGKSVYGQHFNIKDYLKKRFVRLYPIYIVSLLICLIVNTKVSPILFIGNLLFLQNTANYFSVSIPIFTNFSAWSLNYEVLYYLIFIPIFFTKPKIWHLLIVMLVVSLILINSNPHIDFIAGYVNGFYFWLLGLLVAWVIISENQPTSFNLISLLFLHLCQNHLGLGKIILNTLNISSNSNFNWLFDLPFCYLVLCSLTGINTKFSKFNKFIAYLIPALVFLSLTFKGRLFEDERWIMCTIFWMLSVLFFKEQKLSNILRNQLTAVGGISYALYLLHVPMALIVKKFIYVPNKDAELFIKYSLWLVLTFIISYILEKQIQPKVKNFFFKKGVAQ